MTSLQHAYIFPDPDGDIAPEVPFRRKVSSSFPEPIQLPVQAKKSAADSEPFPPLREGIFPFADCADYQSQGGCQVVLHQHYEGNRGDILRCKTCQRTFSERRCGLLFKSRLPGHQVEALSEAYNTGVSIRQAAKDFGLNRGTVRRYYRLLSERGG